MSFEQPPEEQFNKEGVEQENYDPKADIADKLNKGFLESAEIIAEESGVSKEDLQSLVKKRILDDFPNHKDVLHIVDYFKIGEEFLKTKEFVELGKKRVERKLSQGNIAGANEVLEGLKIDKEFLKSEEAKKAAESGIKNILAGDKTDKAIEVQKMFNIDDSFMNSAVEDEIKVRLKDNLVVGAVSLQEKFNIPQEFINDAVKEEVLSRFSAGSSLSNIASFIEKLNMDVSFLSDPKIKEATKIRIKEMTESEIRGQEKIPEIFKEVNEVN
ncbi:MAG: hypothetical protein WC938_03495 [Candidatus Paceibacterota bacterium]|jgi:hypothetical protein